METNQNILAHCRVFLEGTEHEYEGDSGPKGIISFDDIAEDVYTLTVQKDGYEDYVESGIIIDEQNKSLHANVSLKKIPDEITLIVVTTPSEKDMLVTLMDVEGHVKYHGNTDNDGQVVFPKVHYGKYALKVTGKEYDRYLVNITVNSRNNNPRTVDVPLTKQVDENE